MSLSLSLSIRIYIYIYTYVCVCMYIHTHTYIIGTTLSEDIVELEIRGAADGRSARGVSARCPCKGGGCSVFVDDKRMTTRRRRRTAELLRMKKRPEKI